ncbi:Uncharacterized protein DAT39_016941 [Clarias magur]|uniref:Uncharacterized protein n=1 Tax=Clarias magur TaxID=1594786 RepID=A0A8J4TM97_CLAMG|nr:Uncharacterized protein DAT39_016941 [Clarias magur]
MVAWVRVSECGLYGGVKLRPASTLEPDSWRDPALKRALQPLSFGWAGLHLIPRLEHSLAARALSPEDQP